MFLNECLFRWMKGPRNFGTWHLVFLLKWHCIDHTVFDIIRANLTKNMNKIPVFGLQDVCSFQWKVGSSLVGLGINRSIIWCRFLSMNLEFKSVLFVQSFCKKNNWHSQGQLVEWTSVRRCLGQGSHMALLGHHFFVSGAFSPSPAPNY